MNANWHNVNRNEPCPICRKTDWCSVSNDGAMCVCRRIESDRPTKSGYGWIHRLRGAGADGCSLMVHGSATNNRQPPTSNHQPTTTNHQPTTYFASLPRGEIQARLCAHLEKELGLPREMLAVHDVRWDARARAAAFPMRSAAGEVTGIRYRQLKTGRKWALKGSKDGLFLVPGYIPYDCGEIVVCEGPTDMLAAASCGLNAVGRSSCMTGAALLREFVRARRIRRVTIVADNDRPHDRPDGSWWRPGLDGAERLARDLRIAARIVLPPPGVKDMREWYRRGGLTAAKFREAAAGAKWVGP